MTRLKACIFGASGGIGCALVDLLAADDRYDIVHAGARRPVPPSGKVKPFAFDLTNESAIAAAAAQISEDGPLDLVFVATGILHRGDDISPEKSWRSLDSVAMAEVFAINTIGPALIGKHMLPLLARDRRAVFAALSARVGSIGDNRLGGWHAYRASKAALNMMVRNFALELTQRNKAAIAVTLHPGTVATPLSAPFQARVTPEKLFTPAFSAERLLHVLEGLNPEDSGKLLAWDGAEIPF